MMPELPSRLSIEGESIIRGSDEQNAVHRNGSHFKAVGALRVKNPLGSKLRNVSCINLAEGAVTAARIVSVVGNPVPSDRLRKQITRAHVNFGGEGGHPGVLCECRHRDQEKEP